MRDDGLGREFITPYTPEPNGLVERVFRNLKEECVRQRRFRSLGQAERAIGRRIRGLDTERPQEALGFLPPAQWRRRHQAA